MLTQLKTGGDIMPDGLWKVIALGTTLRFVGSAVCGFAFG